MQALRRVAQAKPAHGNTRLRARKSQKEKGAGRIHVVRAYAARANQCLALKHSDQRANIIVDFAVFATQALDLPDGVNNGGVIAPAKPAADFGK